MRPIRWLRRGLVLASVGAAGGALIVTVRHLLETPQPLRSALSGEARIDRGHGSDIYYNVTGPESADPIVLLHDFYPGASNFEYRQLFPLLARSWRVYAPDWLGFGMSEHPPLAYTGEFYANSLIGYLRDVVGKPAIVIARGRAANIAARAATDAPDLFARLVLVSPDAEAGIQLEPKPTQLLARATQRVALGLVPYAFLSTKPLLRQLVRRQSAQTGQAVATDETLDHLYASAHQFGGQHALMSLMTGELDLPLQHLFPLLQPPVLLVGGDEDAAHPLGMMEDLAVLNAHADLDVLVGAGEIVYADQPDLFAETLSRWLESARTRQQVLVEETQPALQAEATSVDTSPAEVAPEETPAASEEVSVTAPPPLEAGSESGESDETDETDVPGDPKSIESARVDDADDDGANDAKDAGQVEGSDVPDGGRPQQATRQARRGPAPRAMPSRSATPSSKSARSSASSKAAKLPKTRKADDADTTE